jgi:putative ABC transport system permease protein
MFSLLNWRMGFFIAKRQLAHASLWTTSLIVFVMFLTFMNLVVITGFLVGIVDGISNLFRTQQTGDVIVSTLKSENYIENSGEVLRLITSFPEVTEVSARQVVGATVEANYKTRSDENEKPNSTGANIFGVDPAAENNFSHLSDYIGEGSYFLPNDYDSILIGSQLIDRYAFGGDIPGLTPLKNVYPGTKVRVTIEGATREVIIRGIIVTTANSPLATGVFMPATEVRQMSGRNNYSQIAIRLKSGTDAVKWSELLKKNGVDTVAQVQTFEEAIPNGVAEVRNTFEQMGNAISSLGLVVAFVTVFIVIFINAVTRRKYIGILKGIGISTAAIETAYVFQSLFYALIGSSFGLLVLYGFLVPYVAAHPIKLPISNAIIVAPLAGTIVRILLLAFATIVAGYIPARLIVRKNTLDSILGRN